jgi:RNA polymerase sigma-70 factor (ECF subfamily)
MLHAHDEIALIRTGDPKAFERYFNQHWPALYVLALKIFGNKDSTKDVMRDVYICLWSRKETPNLSGPLESYVHQAVRFQSIRKLKEIMNHPEEIGRVQEYITPVLNDIWEKTETAEMN